MVKNMEKYALNFLYIYDIFMSNKNCEQKHIIFTVVFDSCKLN